MSETVFRPAPPLKRYRSYKILLLLIVNFLQGSNLQALTTMTCCCSLALCNSPSNGRTIHPNKPLKPPKPSNANPSTLTVDGGIAGAVLFVLLVVVTVGVIVRRCRRVPSETTYSYTQLTADLAEERDEATEDEYMLVG